MCWPRRTPPTPPSPRCFLGLGGVALLVGGIGIANVMVIAVIERRTEIGLRRALGATKAHIRRQFLTEALLLAGAGGVVGVALGAGVTAIAATCSTGRSSCRPSRSSAAWSPRSSSARSPASTPPPAPPACHPP